MTPLDESNYSPDTIIDFETPRLDNITTDSFKAFQNLIRESLAHYLNANNIRAAINITGEPLESAINELKADFSPSYYNVLTPDIIIRRGCSSNQHLVILQLSRTIQQQDGGELVFSIRVITITLSDVNAQQRIFQYLDDRLAW